MGPEGGSLWQTDEEVQANLERRVLSEEPEVRVTSEVGVQTFRGLMPGVQPESDEWLKGRFADMDARNRQDNSLEHGRDFIGDDNLYPGETIIFEAGKPPKDQRSELYGAINESIERGTGTF